MPLRSALEDLRTFRSLRFDAPKQLATAAAANAIRTPTESVETRLPPELDEIADRVRRDLSNGEIPASTDLLRAPWCIWDGERPFAGEPELLERYLRLVETLSRKSHFRRLAAAYAVRFPEDSRALRPVAECLARLSPSFTGAWSSAHEALRIFDAAEAPPASPRQPSFEDFLHQNFFPRKASETWRRSRASPRRLSRPGCAR